MAIEKATYGFTYRVRLEENISVYITINNDEDEEPYEVFLRCDTPELIEWISALAFLISLCLQAGVLLEEIADSLLSISSPKTAHFITGTTERCPSYIARIAQIFVYHLNNADNYLIQYDKFIKENKNVQIDSD